MVNDDPAIRKLSLPVVDGPVLEAEVHLPVGARAAVVLCHPHPQHGGSMRSIVTSELFRILPKSRIAVLRFNFRGVEGSTGLHDGGRGERHDVEAAIDALAELVPDLPLFVSGWSFGGDTSMTVLDPRIRAWVPCAPPLRVIPRDEIAAAAGADPRPKIVIVGEHDQFLTPIAAREATADWTATHVVAVPGADHFFVGRTDRVAEIVTAAVLRSIT